VTTVRVISWGGIGDATLSTAAFRTLKLEHPEWQLNVYWANEDHRDIYTGNPHIDLLQKRPLIRTGEIELNYGQFRPALFCKQHASQAIGTMIGVEVKDTTPSIFLTAEEEESAQALLSPFTRPVIVQTGAISSKNKEWPLENWCRLVAETNELTFLQLGSARDTQVPGAVDLRGRTALRLTCALIKRACTFVSIDSSVQHIGAAVGTSGITIFGPTPAAVFGHGGNINIQGNAPCSPCSAILGKAPCPYGVTCMRQTGVADVQAVLRSGILGSKTDR
jgi:ADP-heptose:LPS heptosyltransferase